MSHQQDRVLKTEWIINLLNHTMKQGRQIRLDALISAACLRFGAGNRYIKEIIKDLENTSQLIIKDGMAWTIGGLKAQEAADATG